MTSDSKISEDWTREEREILEGRRTAVRLGRPSAPDPARHFEVVEGRIAERWFAIDAQFVVSVIDATRLCRLPHAPRSFAGLLYDRGLVLPVFYLREVLGLHTPSLPEHTHALVIGRGGPELALAFDAVAALRWSTAIDATVAPTADTDLTIDSDIVAGVRSDGVIVLDGDALLSSDRFILDIQWKQGVAR